MAAALGPYDVDGYAARLAPDIQYVDRRTLGFGAANGAEAVLRILRSTVEVSDAVATRIDDLLGLRADALLARWTISGIERVGGGAWKRSFFLLDVFGADGLVTRIECFDADRIADALTRFDELAPAVLEMRFENAASRTARR